MPVFLIISFPWTKFDSSELGHKMKKYEMLTLLKSGNWVIE